MTSNPDPLGLHHVGMFASPGGPEVGSSRKEPNLATRALSSSAVAGKLL